MALAAVIAIRVLGHKDTSTARLAGTFLTKTVNLSPIIDAIVLKNGQLDLLALMLDLLGSRIGLLLLLLGTSTQTQDQVQGTLLLDVVVAQGTAILQLLPGKDETLLVRGNSYKKRGERLDTDHRQDSLTLLVLNLGLYILDRVGWLDLKGDGLSGKCLDEDLHRHWKIFIGWPWSWGGVEFNGKNIFKL